MFSPHDKRNLFYNPRACGVFANGHDPWPCAQHAIVIMNPQRCHLTIPTSSESIVSHTNTAMNLTDCASQT